MSLMISRFILFSSLDDSNLVLAALKTTDLLKENSRNRKFRPTGPDDPNLVSAASKTIDLLKENSGNKKFRPPISAGPGQLNCRVESCLG